MNVFQAARRNGAKRLVFASSNWVMAGYRFGTERLTTDLPPWPINPYGHSKLFGERVGRSFAEQHNLSVIAFRIGWCQREHGNRPGPHMAGWVMRDGVRLISPNRLREVTAVSASGTDQVFGNPSTWGLGYAIGGLGPAAQDSNTVFGVGGVGGSFACGDTATGIAFAVTKNRLTPDFNAAAELRKIVKKALARE